MKFSRTFALSLLSLFALVMAACSHLRTPVKREHKEQTELGEFKPKAGGGCYSPEEFVALFPGRDNWWSDVRCDLFREDLDSAQIKLEAVLKAHAGTGHSNEAVAAFFLSEVYFRKGETEKFTAYLRDARARSAQLPGWIKDVELPLRAAQMELRLGALKEFKSLAKTASANLARYQQKKLVSPEDVAKTHLQLGYYRWQQQYLLENFIQQIELWNWSQGFLIQVLESEQKELWPHASSLIVDNYRAIASNIKSWPREIASDPALSAYRQQESQWEMIYHTLHVMEELKVLPLAPGAESNWLLQRVGELASVENDLRKIYFQQPVTSDLTPAGKTNQRPLKTISPDPIFETSKELDPNL
jgi:hypothetical protein